VISEPGRRVLDALAALAPPGPPRRDPPAGGPPGDWVGGVGSAPARAAFVARVADLVGGTTGRALLLNLVGPDDVGAVLDPASPVAVHTESAAPAPVPPVSAVEAKKAPPAPVLPRRAGVAAVAGTAALPVMATAVVLAVLLLTVLVLLL
jgi:hypothetical protein